MCKYFICICKFNHINIDLYTYTFANIMYVQYMYNIMHLCCVQKSTYTYPSPSGETTFAALAAHVVAIHQQHPRSERPSGVGMDTQRPD